MLSNLECKAMMSVSRIKFTTIRLYIRTIQIIGIKYFLTVLYCKCLASFWTNVLRSIVPGFDGNHILHKHGSEFWLWI